MDRPREEDAPAPARERARGERAVRAARAGRLAGADNAESGVELAEPPVDREPSRESAGRRRGKTGGSRPARASRVHTETLRDVLEGLREMELGDFSVRLTNGQGDELAAEVVDTFNRVMTMRQQLNQEVVRVSTAVGREGRLTERVSLGEVHGGWATSVESINTMIGDLVQPTAEIARVIQAVAEGDLSQKVSLELEGRRVRGEFARIANIVNTMVDQLRSFANEVTRVAREVGTDGKLGGQARVEGVAGTWKDLTDSVNAMAGNLTSQVRNIADVTTAVARGDLSRKITVDVKGEMLELKNTINTMVDQLNAFAFEVTRVAKEVGTEGKLGGQARVAGVGGIWRDLTENVNELASNLTVQLRDVSAVATAIANGDMTRKITVDARGEILQIKDVINRMVDSLGVFANEVTRVAREVGSEGQLGGQANVPGVAGTWKDLTDSVNAMASNLTDQVRNIADVTTAVARGDLSRKITVDVKGEIAELKHTINVMVDQLNGFASEVTRVAREVGTEGKLGGQAHVPGVAGTWKALTDNVNSMAVNLTNQVRNIALVTTAVAEGDLSQKITVDAQGEVLELKNTVNNMVEKLQIFADEVTRVAREVGTDGVLGGEARVPGVAGTWEGLTDSVNDMATNLTTQVRNIALVTTAVANGDLSQKIAVEAKGEVLELKNTINAMVDRLRVFADEVTRVAREVGLEGKLGGQANVPGVAGTWKALTDNVNQLADNLTTQVRAIADVATAVTRGDLTQQVDVQAQGEVAELKDNINRMILTLKDTTQKNAEQDWLKTNLASFSRMMQGQKDLQSVSRLIMSELTPLVGGHHGAFFIAEAHEGAPVLRLIASYAYKARRHVSTRFALGEGLVGQAALERSPILLTNVPDDYIQINSGLGESPPRTILVLPIIFEGDVKAVLELASFQGFSAIHQLFLDQLAESIGVVLNMIQANMRTEELLEQSQSLASELQDQQEELRRSNAELEQQARTLRESEELLRDQQEELQQVNEELEEKAALLAEQNKKVEQKNREVEAARVALEEKAEQLAISSKYKSEFLANMSHELRTPLNSLLILARLLAENKDDNLTEKQVEFAHTIYSAGTDLLTLINDVLDLSKVEAGRLELVPAQVEIDEIRDFVERTFRPVAEQKDLDFSIEVQPDVPNALYTDGQRLQQVLKNLLSNAFKFTDRGAVGLTIRVAERGRRFANASLDAARQVLAFAVHDTGVGIAKDKQQLIFEAFQQADGTTSRRYGGTGLGLSISREIAALLHGEIRVESAPGRGSTFTLFVPVELPHLPQRRRTPSGGQPHPLRAPSRQPSVERRERPRVVAAAVADDRQSVEDGDRSVLIVENDVTFAGVLLDMARSKGFKGIVAVDGESALALAREYVPDAITLDLDLPGGMDGWTVLDRLKRSTDTRHIPVHIVSGHGTRQRGLRAGALAFLEKPVSKEALDDAFGRISKFIEQRVRHLLVVEDDETQRKAIVDLVGDDDIEITAVGTAAEAMETLHTRRVDCMVLDLGIGDRNGFELLEEVKSDPKHRDLPIIIYTGRSLSAAEDTALRRYAETIIVKDVKSPERLLDETALFLHRVESHLPEQKRRILEQLHSEDEVFAGKRILIVDDDVRNIFSLTSLLEQHGMEVRYAENGRDGLALLEDGGTDGFDLVLMDVMMPEMDGYEATRKIREHPEYKSLPVICLTAKAMKGDREKCIDSGASDYIVKPVDPEQLLSLMRVWLYR
ncbi:MAG TPA: response regulator [Gemmatimonadaceae bacterium]|nr:response regulator [Gemmatimonadaceae bacterium]